jgi:hypothetical protein
LKKNIAIKVKALLTFLLVLNLIVIHGQGLNNSPYSSLGLGENLPIGYSENQAMGGVGVASSIGIYVNTLNPALLTRNNYTVFSMGMLGQQKGLSNGIEKQKSFAMNLNYVNLSFPIKKKWKMGVAIQPYSYTNFNLKAISASIPNDTTKYITNFNAKGGIYKLAWNNAFEIGKQISVGIETNVLFGQINRTTETQIQNDNLFYKINFNEQQNYTGLNYRIGAAWHKKLSKDKFFNLGIVVQPAKNINGDRLLTSQVFTFDGNATTLLDTIPNSVLTAKVLIPADYKFGISFENLQKYTIFADFGIGKNSQFKNIAGLNDGLKNTMMFGIGGEYFPSFTSTKFLKRSIYRAGFNYATSPYSNVKDGTQLKDVNFSMGVSLPLRNLSLLNIGYTTGRRGTKSNGGFLENYNRISIGFTLNDVWFVKQKID